MIMRQLLCSKLAIIQNYLIYTTFFSEILPLIFCILFYKKLNTKALKVFFIYAILLFFFSVFSLFLIKVIKARFLYLAALRVFNICEYSVIAYFLYQVFQVRRFKNIVRATIPIFIIYAVSDYIITDKSNVNSNSNIVSALLAIMMIVYYFYEKMKTVVLYPLYQSIVFWICVSFFLYFTGTFFFFIFLNSSTDKEFKVLMNSIYGFVTILKNIILCLALFASENTEEQEDNILRIPNEIELDEFSLTDFKSP